MILWASVLGYASNLVTLAEHLPARADAGPVEINIAEALLESTDDRAIPNDPSAGGAGGSHDRVREAGQ
jgi:hypothetical protein